MVEMLTAIFFAPLLSLFVGLHNIDIYVSCHQITGNNKNKLKRKLYDWEFVSS